MNVDLTESLKIRQLSTEEEIPYHLLLLADPSQKLIDDYLLSGEVYVASLEEAIVGAYVLTPLNDDEIEIKNIAVETEYQNKGLGSILLDDATLKAKEKSFKILIIGTADSSLGQLYLYQKQGFEISGIKKDFFIENYEEPIYENGVLCRHMIVLTKHL
ncbi:GNAT family N-acetyltransferase [Runella zeae]|uniref:GNAT family N-acetyltransferase n=1 Tax=Runella zeae TaxID=94255 RepID=UPI002353F171|nr:GNAT family N-acetyltransferase [Runella zeae]